MVAKDALLAQLHKKLTASLDLLSVQTDKAGGSRPQSRVRLGACVGGVWRRVCVLVRETTRPRI